jgi:hypothetical protein
MVDSGRDDRTIAESGSAGLAHHGWPADGQCAFDRWQSYTGMPNAKMYRKCIHPYCPNVEYKDVPNA